MEVIGARLREERERMQWGVGHCADLGGVGRLSQRHYEAGVRMPDSEYLVKLAAKGLDLLYVLTGRRERKTDELSEQERQLLDWFAAVNPSVKDVVQRVALLGYLAHQDRRDYDLPAAEPLARFAVHEPPPKGAIAPKPRKP